ncbi:OmpA family protein [Marinivivus vitaminiproducens]|uniref:OmpA family protein n=1 Tax=Marinivivus vitaminiproducens TaxID=3035935 RepID=UPI0027A9BC02|nr:OmpA family protein [Geminicoccaceae bacterium SCSIO 64248]
MFNQGLRVGYIRYADEQYEESNFSGNFMHMASKAIDSAKNEMVLPDLVESRSIPSDRVEELSAARARLMAALEAGARKKAALEAARAQTAFDCWLMLEELREDPTECRLTFYDAISKAEAALGSDMADVYLVFFAWDSVELTPVTETTLDDFAQALQRGNAAGRLVVAGHTDRSGSESYNEGLSERRARAIAEALADRGVSPDRFTIEWFGESQPRVPTADGVREPQNRRVEISVR